MTGFTRTPQPRALSRAEAVAAIHPVAIEAVAAVMAAQDPFLIDHDCINPAGHDAIASCGEVVCRHCAKVFWR